MKLQLDFGLVFAAANQIDLGCKAGFPGKAGWHGPISFIEPNFSAGVTEKQLSCITGQLTRFSARTWVSAGTLKNNVLQPAVPPRFPPEAGWLRAEVPWVGQVNGGL